MNCVHADTVMDFHGASKRTLFFFFPRLAGLQVVPMGADRIANDVDCLWFVVNFAFCWVSWTCNGCLREFNFAPLGNCQMLLLVQRYSAFVFFLVKKIQEAKPTYVYSLVGQEHQHLNLVKAVSITGSSQLEYMFKICSNSNCVWEKEPILCGQYTGYYMLVFALFLQKIVG